MRHLRSIHKGVITVFKHFSLLYTLNLNEWGKNVCKSQTYTLSIRHFICHADYLVSWTVGSVSQMGSPRIAVWSKKASSSLLQWVSSTTQSAVLCNKWPFFKYRLNFLLFACSHQMINSQGQIRAKGWCFKLI